MSVEAKSLNPNLEYAGKNLINNTACQLQDLLWIWHLFVLFEHKSEQLMHCYALIWVSYINTATQILFLFAGMSGNVWNYLHASMICWIGWFTNSGNPAGIYLSCIKQRNTKYTISKCKTTGASGIMRCRNIFNPFQTWDQIWLRPNTLQ